MSTSHPAAAPSVALPIGSIRWGNPAIFGRHRMVTRISPPPGPAICCRAGTSASLWPAMRCPASMFRSKPLSPQQAPTVRATSSPCSAKSPAVAPLDPATASLLNNYISDGPPSDQSGRPRRPGRRRWPPLRQPRLPMDVREEPRINTDFHGCFFQRKESVPNPC